MKIFNWISLFALHGMVVFVPIETYGFELDLVPSQEEMWDIIQEQQEENEKLTALIEANAAETEKKLSQAQSIASEAQAEASRIGKQLKSTQAQVKSTEKAVKKLVTGDMKAQQKQIDGLGALIQAESVATESKLAQVESMATLAQTEVSETKKALHNQEEQMEASTLQEQQKQIEKLTALIEANAAETEKKLSQAELIATQAQAAVSRMEEQLKSTQAQLQASEQLVEKLVTGDMKAQQKQIDGLGALIQAESVATESKLAQVESMATLAQTEASETKKALHNQEEQMQASSLQEQQIEKLTALIEANAAETEKKLSQAELIATQAQAAASRMEEQLQSTQAQLQASEQAVEKLIAENSQAQKKQIDGLGAMIEAKSASTERKLAQAQSMTSIAQAEVSETKYALQIQEEQMEVITLAVEDVAAAQQQSDGWWTRTFIGGYGVMNANFYDGSQSNEVDLRRFTLFFNHDFNDWVSLYSDLEFEQASLRDSGGASSEGQLKLDQAFIRLNWTEQFSTDAGVFLVPLGILNETREPNTFYGVERNRIEHNIIPTTWSEGGARATYDFRSWFMVEAGVTSGLNVNSNYNIREGAEAVSNAPVEEPAYFSRIRFTGIPGLELAGSVFYQDDMAENTFDADFSGLLSSGHMIYSLGGFTLKALYAQWNLSGDVADSDAEFQYGYYVEPSYRLKISQRLGDLGVFFRYSDYEYYDGGQRQNELMSAGFNWWPTDNVVFKADIESYENGADDNGNTTDHSVNLGVGYQF